MRADFFKLLSAQIVKEEPRRSIVRDERVQEAIAVVVGKRYAHPFAHVRRDSRFFGDIGERAISIVAVQGVVQRRINLRMAVPANAAFHVTIGILVDFPNAVVDHKQIQLAVVVVIEPACAD